MRLPTLIFTLLLATSVSNAQHTLSSRYNQLRPDSINKEIIPFFAAGCEGENVTWDFSDIEYEENPDTTAVAIYCLDDVNLWDDNGTMTTYNKSQDSLLISREETPLYEMDFDTPIVRLAFPLRYGDVINGTFSGHGVYENNLSLEERGTSAVNADAHGQLILTEGHTIRNVLRVHTTLESDLDVSYTSNNEYVGTLHKTTDTYEWYARGYRYPVLKATTNLIKAGDAVISLRQTAERISPEMQLACEDEDNEELRDQDAISGNTLMENLSVQTHGNVAKVSYTLTEDAHVQITLASSTSIVYWTYSADETAGVTYSHDVPLTGLMRGQYGININVNGVVQESKVNVE